MKKENHPWDLIFQKIKSMYQEQIIQEYIGFGVFYFDKDIAKILNLDREIFLTKKEAENYYESAPKLPGFPLRIVTFRFNYEDLIIT